MKAAKLMVLLTRRAGVDASQFTKSWRSDHAPLMAALPGLRRYVRNEIVEEVPRDHMANGMQIPDGIEELWFDAEAAPSGVLKALPANGFFSAEGGIASAVALTVSEHLVFERPHTTLRPLKRLTLLTRKQGMTNADFTHHWRFIHAPLTSCHRFVDRYVQNHVLDHGVGSQDRNEPRVDGVGEFLIADLLLMQEDYLGEAGIRMKQDVGNFVGSARTCLVCAHEVSIPAS